MISRTASFWNTSPHFRGAFWKVSFCLCFSAINGIVRYLSQVAEFIGQAPLPAYEVAFFQSLFGLIFLMPWVFQNGSESLKTRNPFLQTCRICLSAIGIVLCYTAFAYMPLAQAVALMFLGPLITAVGARIFLKETISAERRLAIIIGFVGGIAISQTSFDMGTVSLIALLPVLAATCFSGATLMLRRLAKEDSPQLNVTYLLLFTAPLLFIPTLLFGAMPEPWQWPWLLMIGGFAASAHLCLSKAYATTEVSYLIPYGFTKWFASALIGVTAFGEFPSFWTCLGSLVLMATIIFLSFGEVRRSSRGRIAA
ncbi:MAG TPA: DMT family transporter [Alphaproteobacteria bacterium]|nr:DMT family transporter [Alphaproteobacteria bacterium]